jgi:hypothetical protein
MNIVITGTLDSIRSLKDRSIKFVIETSELKGEEASKLFNLGGKFLKVLLTDANIISEQVEAIESFKVEEDNGKSPSQRLRAVLYRRWEQRPQDYKTFEDYYRSRMEQYIVHEKGKLD